MYFSHLRTNPEVLRWQAVVVGVQDINSSDVHGLTGEDDHGLQRWNGVDAVAVGRRHLSKTRGYRGLMGVKTAGRVAGTWRARRLNIQPFCSP
jgi:hypothetical protein